MKLYYSPGACSLSPHIALREAGLPFTLVKVDLKKKTTDSGGNYLDINPKGYVPLLQIENDFNLTEGPAIVQYIADQAPQSGLAPANGSKARYQLQEWLNFITSELHKQFSPLFDAKASEEVKTAFREKIAARLSWLDQLFADGREYLTGKQFTVADGYLFTVLNWGQWTGLEVSQWPQVKRYFDRVAARPKVREALAAEGLAK